MIDAVRGVRVRVGSSGHAAHPAAIAASPPSPPAHTRASPVADHETRDDSLLVAAAKRDLRAFAPLYDRYLGPIYRFCLTRLGDIEAAEDATAVVFTKALAAIDGCRESHFRPWLFAIARNVVVDAHRATRPHATLDAAREIPDPAPSPAELALHADEAGSVRTLLARLTPEQRDIVELRLAGLTGPEIARALGRSHAAIRVAQFRAYARLRSLLGPTGGDPDPMSSFPDPTPDDRPERSQDSRKEPTR